MMGRIYQYINQSVFKDTHNTKIMKLYTYQFFDSDGYPMALTEVVSVQRDQDGKITYMSTIAPDELEKLIKMHTPIITHLSMDPEAEVAFMNALFAETYPAKRGLYEHVRIYGGAEEGGWYYSNYIFMEDVTDQPEVEYTSKYPVYDEFISGENENTMNMHYC